jgi:hypothetical protein
MIDTLKELGRQVGAVVDASVHAHILGERHLFGDFRAVRVGVEHDDRVCEHVRRVGVRERARVVVLQ